MPFLYCTQCGYKNTFTTRRAKFCAGCGASLLEEAAGNSNPPSTQLESAHAHLEEESELPPSIPRLEKLEYTVDATSKPPTIGDLISTKKDSGNRSKKVSNEDSKVLTPKEIEAESMRACASSKERTSQQIDG